MTDEQNPQPVAASATAQALVENAGRLGLTWDLRPATVNGASPVSVIIDGDDAGLVATSMIGSLVVGDRVYVIKIPPGGLFIVGWVNAPSNIPRLITDACSSAASAAIGAEAVVLTTPSATFENGRAFEIRVKSAYSVTIAGFALHLVRRGITTAGAAIAEWEMPSVAGGVANCFDVSQQLTNTSGTDVTQQLALTFISTAGTGSLIDVSPFGPFYFQVWDIGPSSNYQNRDPI